MKTQIVPNPKATRTSTAPRRDKLKARLSPPINVEFSPADFERLKATASRMGITPEQLILTATEKAFPPCQIPPRASRLQNLLAIGCDPGNLIEDGHALQLLVDLPGIQILRGPDGFIVDQEARTDIKIDGSGKYCVQHTRELLSREMALHELLFAVIPKEFHDLLQPAFEVLELADN